MSLRRRPHQRGLIVRLFLVVHAGAAHEERLDGVCVAGASARHQHGLAVERRGIRIGAGRQQALNHRGAAVRAGHVEGRSQARDVGGAAPARISSSAIGRTSMCAAPEASGVLPSTLRGVLGWRPG